MSLSLRCAACAALVMGVVAYGLFRHPAASDQEPRQARDGLKKSDGAHWEKSPPLNLVLDDKLVEISRKEYSEVVASRNLQAELQYLQEKSCTEITVEEARSLAGSCFSCPDGKKPYLLRAIYGNANGGYRVRRLDKKIYIHHGSLGHHRPLNKSALIINLGFEPEEIYLAASFTL